MKPAFFFLESPTIVPPPSFTSTLRGLWCFAWRPYRVRRERNVKEVKLPLIFQILLIDLTLKILLLTGLAFMSELLQVETQGGAEIWAFYREIPFLLLFATMVLIAPAKEEIIFRLPLVYSGGFIGVSGAVLLYTYGPVLMQRFNLSTMGAALVLLPLLALLAGYLGSKRLRLHTALLWRRHYGLVFYAFTALFALMHLLNYNLDHVPCFMLPVLLLPQFVGGISLGYTRLRLGFGWAVAHHAFHNAVALLMIFAYLTS